MSEDLGKNPWFKRLMDYGLVFTTPIIFLSGGQSSDQSESH